MEELNNGLKTEVTFESFETNLLNQYRLTDEEQTAIFNTFDEIIAHLYEDNAARPSSIQRYEIRQELWDKSYPAMRTALVFGTILRGGWNPKDRIPYVRDDLFFETPEELIERIAGTGFEVQAASHIIAINNEFMRSGFVPARMIDWNAAIYENAYPSQQRLIMNSIKATHFGYFSHDSEAQEPYRHSVELILNDDKFPAAFKPHVIELALREIEAGEGYEELPSALGRTYRAMPEEFGLDAARRIRKIFGMPPIVGSHEETIARDRQEQAEAVKNFTEWWNGLLSSARTPKRDFSKIIGSHLLKPDINLAKGDI